MTTRPSLSELHRKGSRKDSITTLARDANTTNRVAQGVIDFYDLPEAARNRVVDIILRNDYRGSR